MTTRIPLRRLPVLLALPVLALLAGSARADEAYLSPAAQAALKPVSDAQLAFDQARSELEGRLSNFASTLENQLTTDDVQAAEAIYGLERQAIALLQHAESYKLTDDKDTHEATVGGLRAMLQRILRYQDRVKDYTQDKLDQVLPGEPGRKLVLRTQRPTKNGFNFVGLDFTAANDSGETDHIQGKYDAYKPLFRQGTPQPGQPEISDEQRLAEMRTDFADKGGDLKRDIKLLGLRYLQNLRSGQLAEWTQIGIDKISITTAGAKHPVIGGGRAVRGAGSVKVYRDTTGEIVLAVVSNSSGNYKPGVSSVEGLVNKLIELGVPEERILTTSVVPEEPELVKLLLKARMTPKDSIKSRVDRLQSRTDPKRTVLGRVAPMAQTAKAAGPRLPRSLRPAKNQPRR